MFCPRSLLMRSLSVLVALACCSPIFAIELVRDINQQTTTAHSLIQPPVEMGSLALFIHDDAIHGRELWATDGTAAGTRLVRDINPGLASADVNSLTVINGVVYFWANDGTNGTELWRSDGTQAGTRIVVNIGPGSTGFGGFMSHGAPIQTLDGVLYFSADDGTSGIELWRSDGTAAGTYRLIDVAPGGAGSEPENFLKLGSRLFFNVRNPQGGNLWTTDGTVSGTRRVTTTPANDASLPLYHATVVGDVAFVGGGDPVNGAELWRIYADGTASLVADLNTYSSLIGTTNSSTPRAMIPSGDGVLFVADTHVQAGASVLTLTGIYRAGVAGSAITKFFDSNMYQSLKPLATISGRTLFYTESDFFSEIWTTDGTLAGTARVRPNDQALVTSLTSSALVRGDGEVFFYARHGNVSGAPTTLWRSDGTAAGTREYWSPAQPLVATDLARLNGRLYFTAGRFTDPDAGDELWTTDGTPSGTQRVADINPGPNHSGPRQLTVVLGKIFFTADDGIHGQEPWMFDGTNAVALGDLTQSLITANAGPNRFTRLGDGMLFIADDGLTGQELWYSDGTRAGTQLVRDIHPGAAAATVSTPFQPLADFVLFGADDGTSGRELWRTDGTNAGTFRVADIAPGASSSDPWFTFYANHVLNGVAYFSANDGVHGKELWRSDGTPAGTYMVTELTPGDANSHVVPFGVANGRFIFLHQDSGNGNLWATDGTPAGTSMINSEVHASQAGVTFGNYLYFAGASGVNETYANHLWRTDGTSAGTERVTVPGTTRFIARRMRTIQAGLVIDGCSGSQTCGLYIAQDASNVSKLIDADVQEDYVGDDSQLFFLNSIDNQLHIYRTDGTVAGSGPLLPGFDFGGSVMSLGSWFQGWLFFTVNETGRGPVIWRTNGTAAGTRRFADMDPGIDTSNRAHEHVVLGTKLLFDGFRPDVGVELFAISADAPNAEDDSAQGAFNAVVTTNVLENDTAFTGALNPGSLEIIVAPRFGTASVNAATGAITYTPQAGFSGADSLVYQVRDDQSRLSNSAALWMTIAADAGSGPGNSPAPNPPDPPPSGGGGGGGGASSGGGGGGGAIDWLSLMFLSLMTFAGARRRSSRRSVRPAGD